MATRGAEAAMSLAIALYQPLIPQNTGNIIRLAANTGVELHLIGPLGFAIDHAKMRRAGLDYHEFAALKVHASYAEFAVATAGRRLLAIETNGTRRYSDHAFRADDILLFGQETKGIANDVLASLPPEQILRIPMRPDSRSFNLANTVAIVCLEALRQLDFAGLA
jgi:tRNA (cytidine/uridine-2'-O-)-methyltransferase